MKLTKKEIYDHFTFGVEVEEADGYRYWIPCEGYEAFMETVDRVGKEGKLSDADFGTRHSYPGMQEFYDGFFTWSCENYMTCDHSVNTYYDTVYAIA